MFPLRGAALASLPLGLAACGLLLSAPLLCHADTKPVFASKIITNRTPGHAVDIEADITGAKRLYLIVRDGGNGYACDWADWAEPRLIGPNGEKKLTELKWKEAWSAWGQVRINRNCANGPLKINGRDVEYGLGTHANSLISFELPAGYTRFEARGGLDNGGTDQAGGGSTSVQFLVFTDLPPKALTIRESAGGGGDQGSREPEDALAGLDVAEGLEATLAAHEPGIRSLTNLDVDHRGRVWVCDVVNYRGNNGKRPEGDRILILEDTNGDGVMDKEKVFYQGRDIDSAMGVCVLGDKVIVSATPNVWVFTDADGDDRPDKKEALFTGIQGVQHDHSVHAVVFGPDGKLYFNFGNAGRRILDGAGQPVVDLAGNEVTDRGQPYRQGMIFRCNLDGSEFETLAHNFRNNYEVAVDSFGGLWQSDNDDDGNRGVRINFVVEHGNYGYVDEMTGAGWRKQRTGMHPDIPQRHWHQNDPGVMPNLLLTGQGSPTGILVYEGQLLPEVFRGQVIHCDAGPNVVRAYPVTAEGAGYRADIENILVGTRDKWFRPADVCTAPDGSLFIADWYDPGVGGHRQGDIDRGRLFRVAPPGTPYEVPEYDVSTPAGAVAALNNPCGSVRYVAWQAIQKLGDEAAPALKKQFENRDAPPHLRARALWALGKLPGGETYIDAAIQDDHPRIRIVGLRLARQLGGELLPVVERLVRDDSPAVRRECAVALWNQRGAAAAKLWAELAYQHDGKDRWYLEALGIGARGDWDACLDAWLEKVGGKWDTPVGRDIVWRSRAKQTPDMLADILLDDDTPLAEKNRCLRAFDFLRGPEKDAALKKVLGL